MLAIATLGPSPNNGCFEHRRLDIPPTTCLLLGPSNDVQNAPGVLGSSVGVVRKPPRQLGHRFGAPNKHGLGADRSRGMEGQGGACPQARGAWG